MDTSVEPPLGSWIILRNGVPTVPWGGTWITPVRYELDLPNPYAGTVTVTMQHPGNDPGLRTAALKLVEPFGPIDCPDPPPLNGHIQHWMDEHSPPPPPGTPEREQWNADRLAWIRAWTEHGPP